MTIILFRKISESAHAPSRAHEGDAGFDVSAVTMSALGNGVVVYGTGLAFAVPKGRWLMAVPRSSVYKTGLMMCNGVGVIDSGYRGEVKAMFCAVSPDARPYHTGDRIMQLILMPCTTDDVEFREVDELPESFDGRGTCGFGSSGI